MAFYVNVSAMFDVHTEEKLIMVMEYFSFKWQMVHFNKYGELEIKELCCICCCQQIKIWWLLIYLTFNLLKPNQSICLPASATRTIMMETLWRVDVSQLGPPQRLNIYYFGPIRLEAIDPASQRYLLSWKWKNGKR